MKKTAEEILKAEFVDGEWEELMSYMNTDITPSIVRAMDKHADQFRPKWIHISTPPTKEGTYLVIWKCGGTWVDQVVTFPGEDKVRFMSFDIEWYAAFPEGPERKEDQP